MLQLATSCWTLTGAVSSFWFLNQPCGKTYPVIVENILLCFRGLRQAKKMSQEITETTETGLRTVQCIMKPGRIVVNHHLWWRNLTDFDLRSLKSFMKSNINNSTVELTAMLNSESKSVSTWTMLRELKGLGLKSCVALTKPIISEANQGKKALIY